MNENGFFRRFVSQSKTVIPLFRYLVLQTETHAFCLGLACAALIGFYPFCFLLLSVVQYVFRWNRAIEVVIATLREYHPAAQEFLHNLQATVATSGKKLQIASVLWILVGAAGVFIPLESGLNRLWKVEKDRPYWRNQIVGVSLTAVCAILAVAFVTITASIQAAVHFMFGLDYLASATHVFLIIRNFTDSIILRLSGICFLSIAILLFYKFLPNRKIELARVLPAAVLAGIIAEVVKEAYILILPRMHMERSQGPFFVSVSFVVLAYFEAFVVLGGAFLTTQEQSLTWLQFNRFRKKAAAPPAPPPPQNEPLG